MKTTLNGELALTTARDSLRETPSVLPSRAPVVTSGGAIVTQEKNELTSSITPRRLNRVRVPSRARVNDPKQAGRFLPLARWEGVVTERFESYFAADVIDLDTGEEASAEFDMSQVVPGDIPLCEPGSLFYWSVGYQVSPKGQRKRSNYLRFRRVGNAARG
jgi:hypothetical protein